MSSAGGINGDDISDIIVGTPWAENYETGQAYVIYGEDSFPSLLEVSSLNGDQRLCY